MKLTLYISIFCIFMCNFCQASTVLNTKHVTDYVTVVQPSGLTVGLSPAKGITAGMVNVDTIFFTLNIDEIAPHSYFSIMPDPVNVYSKTAFKFSNPPSDTVVHKLKLSGGCDDVDTVNGCIVYTDGAYQDSIILNSRVPEHFNVGHYGIGFTIKSFSQ